MPVLRGVNSSLLIIEWETPFTWPYTSIHHYIVSVNNTMEDWNQTITTNSLEIRASGGQVQCTAYAFTVLGNNQLADGPPGTVIGGFPIGK